jgi:membrane-associated phospholipid phosphatase
MFQAELVLWLQSLESPGLTWLLSAVTLLGYGPVYVVLILTLAFGVRLRPSLAVLVALLLSAVLTEALKSGFALPRPNEIDARVAEPGDLNPGVAVVERGGGASFWALPTSEAIAAARARQGTSYGFPSGHVSSATAFFIGVALLFRSMRALLFAAFWVPLMAMSRMYLGRHFLADVLGGVAVGLGGVLAAVLLLRGLERKQASEARAVALAPLALVCLTLAVLTPFASLLDPGNVGRLVGVAVAWGVVLATGCPSDHGSIPQRGGRVLAAAAVYLATSWLVHVPFEATGWEDTRLGALAAAALVTALALAGAVAVSRRAGLYVAG